MYLYTWLVKPDTIEGPYLHYAGEAGKQIYDCVFNFRFAEMKFSMDGTKFAGTRGCRNFYYGDFNRCNGTISNIVFKEIPIDTSYYIYGDTTLYYDSIAILAPTIGITFSPNNQYIYLSCGYRIWQYEPLETDSATAWYQVMKHQDTTDSYPKGSIQYAPDSTLLIFAFGGSAGNGYINGIVHPDKKGKACQFKSNVVSFPAGQNFPYFSHHPNHPNWALGKDDRICWPLGNDQLAVSNEQFSMYPNPASNTVKIVIPKLQNQELSIYSASGQKMYSKNMNQLQMNIDVSRWVHGVYYVKVGGEVKKMVISN